MCYTVVTVKAKDESNVPKGDHIMLKLLFIAVTALTAATAAAAAKAAMDTKKTDTAESVVAEERIIIPSERETAECLFI